MLSVDRLNNYFFSADPVTVDIQRFDSSTLVF